MTNWLRYWLCWINDYWVQAKHDEINANHVRVELLIRDKYYKQLHKND